MFKLALDAGHYLKTAGRRVSKKFDKNQTREWVLNDRIARYIAQFMEDYAGVQVLRVDDPTGKTLVGLQERCDRANDYQADFYLSIHHNAGISGGKGGGIVAYGYQKPFTYRDAIYDACVKATGLKGNRAKPKVSKGFHVLKKTKMMAVLMECGFMDSSVDAPIILTDEYAKKMAKAMVEAIAKLAGLKKKPAEKTVSVTLPVLEKGADSIPVIALQALLYCTEDLDSNELRGYFGDITEQNLKAFQKENGLTQTGVCDEKEWQYLLGVSK